MDDKVTQANLAAALGVDEAEISGVSSSEPTEQAEVETEVEVEGDETAEFEMGDEDAPEEEEEEHSEEETTSEEPGDSMDYAESTTIKAALAKDGLPQDLIEALSEDQLLSYMAKRSERDTAFDDMKSDLKRFKSKTTDDAEKTDEGGAPTIEPDNTTPVQVDLSALSEEYGDGGAKTIAAFVQSAVSQVEARTQSRVEAATAPLLEAIGQMIDTNQRSRLSEAVSGGLADDKYMQVRQRAIELGGTTMYQDLSGKERQDALFDAALRIELPDAAASANKESNERRSKKRRNGLPSHPGRKSRKAEKLSFDEMTMARAMAAAQGKSGDEIRESLG